MNCASGLIARSRMWETLGSIGESKAAINPIIVIGATTGPAKTFAGIETSEKRPELGMELSLLSAGSYETVLVILQDLVAQEFEESFDHIDTVVKAGDSSTVEIDGVEGQ